MRANLFSSTDSCTICCTWVESAEKYNRMGQSQQEDYQAMQFKGNTGYLKHVTDQAPRSLGIDNYSISEEKYSSQELQTCLPQGPRPSLTWQRHRSSSLHPFIKTFETSFDCSSPQCFHVLMRRRMYSFMFVDKILQIYVRSIIMHDVN